MKLTRKWATTVIYKGRSLAVISPSPFPLFTPSICLCLLHSLSLFVSTYFGLPTRSSILSTHHFSLIFSPSSSCFTFSLPFSLFPSCFRKMSFSLFSVFYPIFKPKCVCMRACVRAFVCVCEFVCVNEWRRCVLNLSESICFPLPVEIDYVFHSFFSHWGFFFSLSHTHFVLPTQGQLEDCFQPPVSFATPHALLYVGPSTPLHFWL